MKKYILFLVILLAIFANNSIAQRVKRKGTTPIDVTKNKEQQKTIPQFFINQFVGKWQEIERATATKKGEAFTDTAFFEITQTNKASTMQGNRARMVGEAIIDNPGNVLLVAADAYTILKADETKIILKDEDEIVHIFEKREQFWNESFGKLKVEQENYNFPIQFGIKDIVGKWNVYKRQSTPGSINSKVNLIKFLVIKDTTDNKVANGEITFYQSEKTETQPCTISINSFSLEIKTEKNSWTMFVYKVDKKELVFGETGILLYFG